MIPLVLFSWSSSLNGSVGLINVKCTFFLKGGKELAES